VPLDNKHYNKDLIKHKNTRSAWTSIVSQYTSRALTNPMDKLPALSGVASTVASQGKDDYVAGLWKSDLHMGLSWKIDQSILDPAFTGKPPCYRGPSWSWVSTDYSVGFHEVGAIPGGNTNIFDPTSDDRHRDLRVDDIQVHLSGLDPFGQVTAATLRGVGRIKCGVIRRLRSFGSVSFSDSGIVHKYEISDDDFVNLPWGHDLWFLFDTAASQGKYIGIFNPDSPEWKDLEYSVSETWLETPRYAREVFCLCIWFAFNEWVALALDRIPSSAADRPVFRRLGLITRVGIETDSFFDTLSPLDWFAGTVEQAVEII
jgi:hypothetical protein